MGKQVNGWSMALDGGRYGTNYLNRAAWTYFAIGTNLADDAVYPHTDGNWAPPAVQKGELNLPR